MTTTKKSSTAARRTPASQSTAPRGRRSATRIEPHDVVAALIAEHRYAARLLDVLEQQLDLVARDRALDVEAALGVMDYMTRYPDAYHHPREDAMFARLARRDPRLRTRIAELERAHRTIGAAGRKLLDALQRRRGGGGESALTSRIADYVSALREHMAIEEREVFPRARRLLGDEDLVAIERDFRRVTDPIFEASVRDAYAAYPAVVRLFVEEPAVRQILDALDTFFESASTLGETLLGGPAAPAVRRAGAQKGGVRNDTNVPVRTGARTSAES